MLRGPAAAFAVVVAVGCTSVLGIDGKYVLEVNQDAGTAGHTTTSSGGQEPGTGGAETGGDSVGGAGMGGTGGEPSTGGASTGGITATSCDTDGHACASGQKCCAAPQQSGSTAMACVDP